MVLSLWFPKISIVEWSPSRVAYNGNQLDTYSWTGFLSFPLSFFPVPPPLFPGITSQNKHARLCLGLCFGGESTLWHKMFPNLSWLQKKSSFILLCVSKWPCIIYSLGCKPKNRIAQSHVCIFPILLAIANFLSHVVVLIYIVVHAVENSHFPTSSSILVWSDFNSCK